MTSLVIPVTFQFPGALVRGARHVAVVGPFNGWDHTVHPLTKTASGDWVTRVYLPPGRIVYSFWVDGASWVDPSDEGRIANGRGAAYSVRQVKL